MTHGKTDDGASGKAIEQKTKNQFEVIKRIDVYIGTTNTKCTIIMSYCAAVIALVFALLGRVDLANTTVPFNVSVGLSSSLSLITAVICMLMACLTIFPITFSSPNKHKGQSLIFYGDIASIQGGADAYIKKVNEITDDRYLEDLSDQVFTLSQILSRKFSLIQKLSIILCIHFLCAISFLFACVFYFLS
ncbi:Pycsar system effector family protein [Pseudomonas syringae]|uniref:Pycsar system effector family protein n=1 Tax=Pseudomonas syringae TaxID=317 RepID=UPI000D755C46|nr:Pycsar system effector family protein [Pseudomonas syringae]